MTKPFRRDVIFHNKSSVAHDGQHRHGHKRAIVEVSQEGMLLVSRHLKQNGCVTVLKLATGNRSIAFPINPNAQFPLHFVTNDDPGQATIVCGICKKEIGTCSVHIKED